MVKLSKYSVLDNNCLRRRSHSFFFSIISLLWRVYEAVEGGFWLPGSSYVFRDNGR
jgi:hypothetical protein